MHCAHLGESSQTHVKYLLAECGFGTAENEPPKVCPIPRGAAALGHPQLVRGLGPVLAVRVLRLSVVDVRIPLKNYSSAGGP